MDEQSETPTSPNLRFRRMTEGDLLLIESLLSDPVVMTHYAKPKSRDECLKWISWNRQGYARDGFGLWILETPAGEFVGECGLTWQPVDGQSLEVGYHIRPTHQRRGYATEAATASVRFARSRGLVPCQATFATSAA
jgi:RimJ/RimL family protein N-acetyltransferase